MGYFGHYYRFCRCEVHHQAFESHGYLETRIYGTGHPVHEHGGRPDASIQSKAGRVDEKLPQANVPDQAQAAKENGRRAMTKEQEQCKHHFLQDVICKWCFWCGLIKPTKRKHEANSSSTSPDRDNG